jgi:hypothetical protein
MAHCGSLIKVKSYIDSMVEPIVNVLVFAHGPYLVVKFYDWTNRLG